MNGLLKKALTVMLSTTLLTSTIPAETMTTVVAESYDVTKVYDNTWEACRTSPRQFVCLRIPLTKDLRPDSIRWESSYIVARLSRRMSLVQ